MAADQQAISQTECWLKSVIIENNFCPFAQRELDRGSIRYSVIQDEVLEACLHNIVDECAFLDGNNTTETTLLIFPHAFTRFDDYLQLVAIAEDLIVEQGYKGIYQLASFHPDYVFADSDQNDAANYTNRSPYPMLHIIRETSVEKALEHYPEPERIPERNVEHARHLGLNKMKEKLDACYKGKIE
jgi:hypothetical protein